MLIFTRRKNLAFGDIVANVIEMIRLNNGLD
jgi:hypothetical protein